MLQFMRDKASSIIIKGVLSLVILAFIFLGIGNFREQQEVTAATVNEEIVTGREFQYTYQRLLDTYRQQFGGALNDDLLKMLNLKEQAMNQLISEKIILQQADRLGLNVSDSELAASISSIPAFQNNGRFDKNRYNRLLQSNRMTAAAFEQNQKQALLVDKLRTLITDSVLVSDNEARQWFDWENARVKITAAVFTAEGRTGVDPAEAAVAAYYEEHKDRYKTPEKRKITYVRVAPARYLSEVKVTEEEIADFYQANQDLYWNEETVEARHILISLEQDADEARVEEARQKAADIYAMVTDEGKDFAETARQYSEGPSAGEGGYLGAFTREDMVAPFSEKAFSMVPGEISEPVRSQFGWHIIKVEKVTPAFTTPLDEVRADIEKLLLDQKAGEYAYEEALTLFDMALDTDSLEQAAAARNLTAVTTGAITQNDTLADVEAGRTMVRQAFEFAEKEISDVITEGNTHFLFQVTEVVPAAVPPLESVQARVIEDLREQMQKEAARAEAESVLEKVKAGQTLEAACAGTQAEIVATGFFGRTGEIPDIGNEPALSGAAFDLTENQPVAPNVVEGRSDYYVVVLNDRKAPEASEFEEKRDAVVKRLTAQKKNEVFMSWLKAMRQESDITIDEAFLR